MLALRVRAATLTVLAACARPPGSFPEPVLPVMERRGLPPVPAVDGPLEPRVVYPPLRSRVGAIDSSFIFGSLGTGRASLTINGEPVRVWPNGAWLAWVRFPSDSLPRFELEARRGDQVRRVVHEVRRAAPFAATGPLWIDTTSFSPRGAVWWPGEEILPLSVRAAEGATLRLLLPDGGSIPLQAIPAVDRVAEGVRAFDRDPVKPRRVERREHYYGGLRGLRIGPSLGAPVGGAPPGADSGSWPVLEAIVGSDTARVRWPLAVTLIEDPPPPVELDDDLERRGGADGVTPGRALPGGTYHWFLPAGTRARVRGRVNGDLRLRLSATSEAWVSVREASGFGPGAVLPRAVLGSILATPGPERRVAVRIPLSYRAPFLIEEADSAVVIRFYHTAGDPNWVQYGPTRGPLARVSWRQDTADEVQLRFQLDRPLWGYRTRWDGADLVLELRIAPAIDPRAPLRGLLVVVDPGHPPAGATGPTGLSEAEANLAVARALEPLLREAGARVVLTRTDDRPLDLWPRVRLADSLEADLLVSIHNNALPDGVNPFLNHGSSVYYFHPRSLPLARAVQEALVAQLGLSDLGVGRGDLALVRGTWMPSVLTEGLFLMMPEQEAALRDPRGLGAYAEAVYRGMVRFLVDLASRGRARHDVGDAPPRTSK